ncbi:MAG: efflux RND transporter periplasmic adaptor subunit [Ferrovibrio sp.]|uniref:efflux RND transporter periplasmic adaptor subunit n=1 Tax=Ferrovibrio sp. TaxID=1917215 RepID=UPI0026077CCA|nr:efflux RND transporter periplasmic adaptor subunit [Ferrovibrio sp.]MCW0232370.1 efflux RND transporter periplasmic adaptor subunit [Ferrovibrio sp.]
MTRSSHSVMAITALASFLLLAGCERAAPPPEPIRPVRVTTASPQVFESRSSYTGEVRARYETNIAFRVGGKIVARYVEIGSEIKKGALLARLDPEDTRLATQNARAQLSAAQANFNQAQTELRRYKTLFDSKVISQAELDRRQNTYNTAEAQLDSARSQLRVAQNQMDYTELHADADGVVTAIGVETGQVVAAGQTVLKLARPEEKEVVFNVAENRLDELRNATAIAISLWAQPEKEYSGVVREIAPGADPATRTYAVKVSVQSPPPGMRLGMTSTVSIVRRSDASVVALPLAALYQQGAEPAVWIYTGPAEGEGTVALRPVKVAAYIEKAVLIADGLREGEKVITAGVHKLISGQTVRLLPEVQSAAAGKKS